MRVNLAFNIQQVLIAVVEAGVKNFGLCITEKVRAPVSSVSLILAHLVRFHWALIGQSDLILLSRRMIHHSLRGEVRCLGLEDRQSRSLLGSDLAGCWVEVLETAS